VEYAQAAIKVVATCASAQPGTAPNQSLKQLPTLLQRTRIVHFVHNNAKTLCTKLAQALRKGWA
jgi:hypothetical protein